MEVIAALVDFDNEAGRQAVERAAQAVDQKAQAARETSDLGPGTAGYTISGAAYRGYETAPDVGAPSPAEPGIRSRTGLGYNDARRTTDYEAAQRTSFQRPR